jgi:hypothetical protein
MKPTKRQIQIVEHFVKKTTKSMISEGQTTDAIDRILNGLQSALNLSKQRKLPLPKFVSILKLTIKDIQSVSGFK